MPSNLFARILAIIAYITCGVWTAAIIWPQQVYGFLNCDKSTFFYIVAAINFVLCCHDWFFWKVPPMVFLNAMMFTGFIYLLTFGYLYFFLNKYAP